MELDIFAQTIREQFVEDNIDSIETTTDIRSLDTWDSLTGMAILAVIADDFGVDIPVGDFKKLNTIQELFDYVQANNK
jgi:acyl carrier protein